MPPPVMESMSRPQQHHDAAESLSSLRTALQEAKNDEENDSQPDDEASADENGGPNKPNKRPKRARACIACRNMKIRCLPVEGQDACLGCSKVNRDCVMPGPARKRQKTVHKVAELEKKINALTDALISQQQTNLTPPKSDSPATTRDPQTNTSTTSDPQRDLERLQQYDRDLVSKNPITFEKGDLDWGCSRWNKVLVNKEAEAQPYVDIVDRGLIDMATATRIFDYYVTSMLPHFPLLAFPPTIFAQDVRTARPMLFLAILTVASPSIKPELNANMTVELTRQLSERILFLGEKSLEIVQAILVHTSCYNRSKYAKDLTFNQLIHSAVVMCLDLGMGKRYKKLDRDSVEEAEIRRTWLACYYFASNVSILLRHPSLVRWTLYMSECVEFFMKSPESTDKDRWLCAMVQTQRMAEEISVVFNMDDPKSSVNFGDTSTQYQLKAFERQLASWPDAVPASVNKHIVRHMHQSLNLYLHEIAIHHDHNVDDFRPDPNDLDKQVSSDPITANVKSLNSGSFVTTRHIAALSECLDACHQVLDSYLALPIQIARSISNLGIVWNTYAAVALIKLHGILHAPDSRFGPIFTPDLKVEWYLDSLIQRLQEVSADNRCPPAEAFVYVVHKLRHWFQHKVAPQMDDPDIWSKTNGKPGDSQAPNGNNNNNKDANEVIRGLADRHNFPNTLPNDTANVNLGMPESQPLQPITSQQQQQSQHLIGTSSLPASQLDPSGGGPSQQQYLATGTTSNMPWSSSFVHYQNMPMSQLTSGGNNGFGVGFGGGAGTGGGGSSQLQQTSDLNAAYNAQNYNINWDDLQFGNREMEVFDEFMEERGWMGYLI